MRVDDILAAFALPAESRVGQRIPKTKLTEHGAPTAADRRLITERVEACQWVAVLKPETVGLAAGQVDGWPYSEIVVLSLTVRGAGFESRLVELVHRAIPYPVVLITERPNQLTLSLACKRPALGGAAGDWVVESVVTSPALGIDDPDLPAALRAAFLASLPINAQRVTDLGALYQGWSERITALAAARISGHFRLPPVDATPAAWRAAVTEHDTLSRQRATLRVEATRERQMARRVAINADIRRIDERLLAIRSTL